MPTVVLRNPQIIVNLFRYRQINRIRFSKSDIPGCDKDALSVKYCVTQESRFFCKKSSTEVENPASVLLFCVNAGPDTAVLVFSPMAGLMMTGLMMAGSFDAP